MVLRRALVGPFAVALLFPFSGRNLFAADISGALEYQANCARCHGADTTGNGKEIRKPGYRPKDLTHISKNHAGKFPRQEIYDIIDGGKRLPGHYNFNSPMPLWGLSFQLKGKEYSKESEAAVKRRIDALLDYLETIQKK
jgi:mono/diheme cytochrome c family protein